MEFRFSAPIAFDAALMTVLASWAAAVDANSATRAIAAIHFPLIVPSSRGP